MGSGEALNTVAVTVAESPGRGDWGAIAMPVTATFLGNERPRSRSRTSTSAGRITGSPRSSPERWRSVRMCSSLVFFRERTNRSRAQAIAAA